MGRSAGHRSLHAGSMHCGLDHEPAGVRIRYDDHLEAHLATVTLPALDPARLDGNRFTSSG